MTLPRRHRRKITCGKIVYFSYFPQGRAWDLRSDYHLIVQAADGCGQVLRVQQATSPEVTPSFVASAIAEGLEAGWRPKENGAPFTLVRSENT